MIDVELAAFFFAGNSIRSLADIRAGQHVSDWAHAIIQAREGLKDFIQRAERIKIFPQSCAWARSIFNTTITMIPELPPGTPVPDRLISQEEVEGFKFQLNSFALMLSEESAKGYVVALERQRMFDLHTLVADIEAAFNPEIWPKLSKFSKREIEEAGRCLAFECYTACGFHLLRAIEKECYDCATLLIHSKPPRRDLGDYIKILTQYGVDARTTAVLDNVRSLERNPLMHPEDWLNQDEAINILCITQLALSRLISCVETMKLFPQKGTP
ncbi:MAG: hypothetical protein WA765_04355 [Candidatus Acidiferrum sp.]